MKIFFSSYELSSSLKHSTRTNRKGALIRIQDEDGNFGYADLHQWPMNFQTQQAQLSLRASERDLQYRKQKKSFWSEFQNAYIENNYLILADFVQLKDKELFGEIYQAIENGFNVFKIKVGKNLELESARLKNILKQLQSDGLQKRIHWRLDFNCALTEKKFEDFFGTWSENEISNLEYIEDPCAYDENTWRRMNQKIPLALDQAGNSLLAQVDPQSIRHLVLKPAIQDYKVWLDWAKNQNIKITVTSYMDHPLGAAEAFRQALEIKNNLEANRQKLFNVAGLRTQFLFETNEFAQQLETKGPSLVVPKGFGLGFDELLKDLKWHSLN